MTVQVAIRAPAKLNLGLEVLGRRDDGYHEVVTVFQAVSLYDDLVLTSAPEIMLTETGAAPAGEDNLVTVALERLRTASGTAQGATVSLTKRIPIAAGLGGASSDAAAALIGARALWQAPVTDEGLRAIGGEIGSDVPFFFVAGTALGTGRGDQITPLPPLTGAWFVIVSPHLTIPAKTPLLFRTLVPDDFSAGQQVAGLVTGLRIGQPPAVAVLPNAFGRPLYALYPELARLPGLLAAAGATTVGLSGAGPSHFALFHDPREAERAADRLRAEVAGSASVALATPVDKPPAPVQTYLKQGTRSGPCQE